MDEADIEDFNKFIEKHWGNQIRREKLQQETVAAGTEISKRGRKPKNEQ